MTRRVAMLALVITLVGAACASGPSAENTGQRPTTTTTTEPPPEGVKLVQIQNASFRPSNLDIDLEEFWIIEWVNLDSDAEYVVEGRRGEFESPPLAEGDRFSIDLRDFDVGILRYHTFRGQQRIPGSIDTRGL